MDHKLCQSITLLKHVFFNVLSLDDLLFEVLVELLLLQHLVGALMDPVFDRVNVDALALMLLFFFLAALLLIFFGLFLQRSQLCDFGRDKLVRLFEIIFELIDSLVLVFDRLFVRQQVLIDIRLEFAESLLAELFGILSLISLLFHLGQLDLHGFQSRLLL